MPADAKTGAAPCVDKKIDLVPAIEADAEGGGFQKPVHLREGGFEPARIVVVGHAATITRAISGDIGRIPPPSQFGGRVISAMAYPADFRVMTDAAARR